MSILATDIKLLESERMTDTTDGGGRSTAKVIVDGQPGNIFQKVSRLDSVYGRVNLRKVYGHVDTANVDTYAGTHAAIIDGPDNDRICVNIFTTSSDFDTRTEARNRVESYVVNGPESRMLVYGRQLVGQSAITTVQREEEALPEVGDVYCLSNETAGVVSTQQYVRVTAVTSEVRTFTDDQGDFRRRIVTLTIGATLRYEFVGSDTPSRLSGVTRTALVRTTTVADAARYFGIQTLAEPVLAEALELRLSSIYSPIVPTTQREAALSNAAIGGATQFVPSAATPLPSRAVGPVLPGTIRDTTVTFSLNGPIVPGSLQLRIGAIGYSGYDTPPIADDSKGTILAGVNLPIYSGYVRGGKVDYETGSLTVDVNWANGLYAGTLYAAYIPAADAGQPAHLLELPVTLATRGTVQVATLTPLPAKGSAFVDFRALGRWYRLRDDGTGALAGDDPAYGTGTVDPITGALVVTLGALPDVGSSIVIGWASPVHYTVRAGATADAATKATQKLKLGVESTALPMAPGSVAISYVSNAVTYNATTDGYGVITGGGLSGKVDFTTGDTTIEYGVRLPDPGSLVSVGSRKRNPLVTGAPTYQSGATTVAGAGKSFAVPTPVQDGTLNLRLPMIIPGFGPSQSILQTVQATANAAGDIITLAGENPISNGGVNWSIPGGDVVGAINFGTGEITLFDGNVVTLRRAFYQYLTGGWTPAADYKVPFADSTVIWVTALDNAEGAQTDEATTFAVADNPITIDLTKTTGAAIVPGTAWFNAFGRTYFDRNGIVYHSIQRDGTATQGGTIDYATGLVTLTDYATGTAAAAISVLACLTRLGDFTAVKAVFRTAGSPLRPASTYVQVTAIDGDVLTATCDQDGNLSGPYARGKVNQEFGLVSIEWGEMVVAAGNETQDWYDVKNVVGSQVWKPREVMPASIAYNAVVISNLPLNADILGLDPVRLPSDGRVPIFRAGDVALLHNTKTTVLPNPVAAGATYSVGRSDVADCFLLDATGTRLPSSTFVADLAAGTVTMAADFVMGALVGPLSAQHRVEELNLLSDVQINGQVTLSSPLSRDFDADTKVSSALLFGDLFARVSNVFDQVSWTSVWSDARIGTDAVATYDTINFPLAVTNSGAVNERWRINFTSANAFQVIGENLGVIGTGTTTADCAPVNALTGKPYFTLRAAGWGLGWSVGNQLRFNTVGATASIWMVRTVLAGAALSGDSVDLQLRGDVDA